jgi:hypothetical protein
MGYKPNGHLGRWTMDTLFHRTGTYLPLGTGYLYQVCYGVTPLRPKWYPMTEKQYRKYAIGGNRSLASIRLGQIFQVLSCRMPWIMRMAIAALRKCHTRRDPSCRFRPGTTVTRCQLSE